MPIFISRGRFTSDAIKGMLAKPENREEAVAKLFQSRRRSARRVVFDIWSPRLAGPLVSSLTKRLQLLRYWLRRGEAACLTLRQLLL